MFFFVFFLYFGGGYNCITDLNFSTLCNNFATRAGTTATKAHGLPRKTTHKFSYKMHVWEANSTGKRSTNLKIMDQPNVGENFLELIIVQI